MRPLRAQNELVILPQLPLMIQDNPRSWVKTWVNQWRLPVRIGHLVQDQNIVHRPRSVHHRARADDSVGGTGQRNCAGSMEMSAEVTTEVTTMSMPSMSLADPAAKRGFESPHLHQLLGARAEPPVGRTMSCPDRTSCASESKRTSRASGSSPAGRADRSTDASHRSVGSSSVSEGSTG